MKHKSISLVLHAKSLMHHFSSCDEGVTHAVQAAFSTKLKFLISYYLISVVFFDSVAVYLIRDHLLQPLLGFDTNTLAFTMLVFTFFALLHPIHF